jgi:hypothetical protein
VAFFTYFGSLMGHINALRNSMGYSKSTVSSVGFFIFFL